MRRRRGHCHGRPRPDRDRGSSRSRRTERSNDSRSRRGTTDSCAVSPTPCCSSASTSRTGPREADGLEGRRIGDRTAAAELRRAYAAVVRTGAGRARGRRRSGRRVVPVRQVHRRRLLGDAAATRRARLALPTALSSLPIGRTIGRRSSPSRTDPTRVRSERTTGSRVGRRHALASTAARCTRRRARRKRAPAREGTSQNHRTEHMLSPP